GVEVGRGRCEAVGRAMAAGATSKAAVEVTQAVLEAMRMRVDGGRGLAQAARARLEELGLGLQLAGLEIYAAMVELLAGEASAARPALERACAEMERLGERGRLPTALAFLARVRYEEGDYDAVLELTARSRELSYG